MCPQTSKLIEARDCKCKMVLPAILLEGYEPKINPAVNKKVHSKEPAGFVSLILCSFSIIQCNS